MNGTEWHVEENGRELAEAEALNDERSERRNATTWDTDRRQHAKPKPCLRIQECLQNMIPLPHTRCDSHQLLVIVQELGFHGRVGHEDEDENRCDDCE